MAAKQVVRKRRGGLMTSGVAGAAFAAALAIGAFFPAGPARASEAAAAERPAYFNAAPGYQGGFGSGDASSTLSGWFGDGWWHERREPLNSTPSMARYLANECILAGVAALAVAALLPTPAGPVAAAALGVAPDVSMMGIAALGCTAGTAAGLASASLVYVWEEPATVREFAVAQAQNVHNAVATAADMLGGVVRQPDQVIHAAVENVQWAFAGLVDGVMNGVAGSFGTAPVMVAGAGQGIPAVPVADETLVNMTEAPWWGQKTTGDALPPSFSVADMPGLSHDIHAVVTY